MNLRSPLLEVPERSRDGFLKFQTEASRLTVEGFWTQLEGAARADFVLFGGDLGYRLGLATQDPPVSAPTEANLSVPLLSAEGLWELLYAYSLISVQRDGRGIILEIPPMTRRHYRTVSGETLLFDPLYCPGYSDSLRYCWRELCALSNPRHDEMNLRKWLTATRSLLYGIPLYFFSRGQSEHRIASAELEGATDLGCVVTIEDLRKALAQVIVGARTR